jgi:hypothetical protein
VRRTAPSRRSGQSRAGRQFSGRRAKSAGDRNYGTRAQAHEERSPLSNPGKRGDARSQHHRIAEILEAASARVSADCPPACNVIPRFSGKRICKWNAQRRWMGAYTRLNCGPALPTRSASEIARGCSSLPAAAVDWSPTGMSGAIARSTDIVIAYSPKQLTARVLADDAAVHSQAC